MGEKFYRTKIINYVFKLLDFDIDVLLKELCEKYWSDDFINSDKVMSVYLTNDDGKHSQFSEE